MKHEQYFTILGWMYNLGCDNLTELSAYAIIYGFSQDGQSAFVGSYSFIQSLLMCSRRTTIDVVARLVGKGLIQKEQYSKYGTVLNSFRAIIPNNSAKSAPVQNLHGGCKKQQKGVQNLHGVVQKTAEDGAKSAPNIYNIDIYNNNITKSSKEDSSSFDDAEVDVDFKALVNYWNTTTSNAFPRILSIDGNRRKMVIARINQWGKAAFAEAIQIAAQSAFLRGQGARGFVCTFDWFIKPTNFQKILEHNYDDKQPNIGTSTAQSAREQLNDIRELASAVTLTDSDLEELQRNRQERLAHSDGYEI